MDRDDEMSWFETLSHRLRTSVPFRVIALASLALSLQIPIGMIDRTIAERRMRRTEAIEDVGDAISPANLARVWDRLFTTRGDSGGSGLGLPIVASVACAHGGCVGVESSPGAGTTFTVELPVTG